MDVITKYINKSKNNLINIVKHLENNIEYNTTKTSRVIICLFFSVYLYKELQDS